MISVSQICVALTPWLGSEFLRQSSLPQALFKRLVIWQERDGLQSLFTDVEGSISREVASKTSGSMRIRTNLGQTVRMTGEDIALAADDVLGVLLDSMPCDEGTLRFLQREALYLHSLSLLKTLYLRYAGLLSCEEKAAIRQTIISCHPRWRWQGWLQ